jgi:hypothetical protein
MKKPTKVKIKSWLKAHKHNKKQVDDLISNDDSDEQTRDKILIIHGIPPEQYQELIKNRG